MQKYEHYSYEPNFLTQKTLDFDINQGEREVLNFSFAFCKVELAKRLTYSFL